MTNVWQRPFHSYMYKEQLDCHQCDSGYSWRCLLLVCLGVKRVMVATSSLGHFNSTVKWTLTTHLIHRLTILNHITLPALNFTQAHYIFIISNPPGFFFFPGGVPMNRPFHALNYHYYIHLSTSCSVCLPKQVQQNLPAPTQFALVPLLV